MGHFFILFKKADEDGPIPFWAKKYKYKQYYLKHKINVKRLQQKNLPLITNLRELARFLEISVEFLKHPYFSLNEPEPADHLYRKAQIHKYSGEYRR